MMDLRGRAERETAEMQVTIEFSGIARSMTGEREIRMTVEEGASYRQIVREMGKAYPGLVGPIISPMEPDALINSTIFSRNGEEIITVDQMGESPRDGDRLILLTVIVGGNI